MLPITLASSSPYRRALLAKLGVNFDWVSPNIDERLHPDESPDQLALRLAEQKAKTVATTRPAHLIIASDQVACVDQRILTKPGYFTRARQQLSLCSGRNVRFHTSLALLNSRTQQLQLTTEITEVSFRHLNEQQIDRYLQREQPFDCAGSFKVEGLGISLFTAVRGDDPNALIGLPLIRLVEFLGYEGIAIP